MKTLAKRLTKTEKEQITKSFLNGESVDSLSEKFNFSRLTISRNLKNLIGEEKYKSFNRANNISNDEIKINPKENAYDCNHINDKDSFHKKDNSNDLLKEKEISGEDLFVEISPLNYEIDSLPQRDLASISLKNVEFPNIVYMIVDKNIELEIKLLRDYPAWDFLSQEDLNRKTIEIHLDIKVAKRLCKKDEKVIKVPNTNVFKIVAPLLSSRGISRIIFNDQLISL